MGNVPMATTKKTLPSFLAIPCVVSIFVAGVALHVGLALSIRSRSRSALPGGTMRDAGVVAPGFLAPFNGDLQPAHVFPVQLHAGLFGLLLVVVLDKGVAALSCRSFSVPCG